MLLSLRYVECILYSYEMIINCPTAGTTVYEYIFWLFIWVFCFATCQLHNTRFYCKCFL